MMTNEAVLTWLRMAYPTGIPTDQYPPLVKLLNRTLKAEQVQQLITELDTNGLHDASDRTTIAASNAEQARVASQQVHAVAERLASVGWPLSSVGTPERAGLLQRITTWLRAGYPQGVPSTDYQPILALLRRQLTDEEADAVANKLIADAKRLGDAPSEQAAAAAILRATDQLPSEEDLERVRGRLAAHGWPFTVDEEESVG